MTRLWWLLNRGLIDRELAKQLSTQQVVVLFQRAMAQRTGLSVRALARVAIMAALGFVWFFLVLWLQDQARNYIGRLLQGLIAPVGMALFLFAGWRIWQLAYASSVYKSLREFGFDVCPRCGYWLRGLGEGVKHCPECGAAREALKESRS